MQQNQYAQNFAFSSHDLADSYKWYLQLWEMLNLFTSACKISVATGLKSASNAHK